MKLTSGVFLASVGRRSYFPLSGISKKQSSVSHSTPEAEIVAMDLAVRAEGIPALTIWEVISRATKAQLHFLEDNSAALRVVQTGKNPTMRHMGRTHKVSLQWLHERFKEGDMSLHQCPTLLLRQEIFSGKLSPMRRSGLPFVNSASRIIESRDNRSNHPNLLSRPQKRSRIRGVTLNRQAQQPHTIER